MHSHEHQHSEHEADPVKALQEPEHEGAGSALPAGVQAKMQGALGADFSGVRVHQGPAASSLGAEAYTQGNHIHFAPGKYDPHSQSGQELLGHELTHVVQQSAGRVTGGQGKGGVVNDAALESEADRHGALAARGEKATVPGGGGGGSTAIQGKNIQRSPDAQAATASDPGRLLGNFLITHYTFALESDPIHAHSPKVSAQGLPADKKYRQSFLGSPYGIKMQGTGLADDGQYIQYAGNDRYKYGVGGAGGTPVAWKTVAVDPSVIPMHTMLEIDIYKARGNFEAKDTGGAIKGKHIDVFAGAIPIAQAYALGTTHSNVHMAGAGHATPAPAHQGTPPPTHAGPGTQQGAGGQHQPAGAGAHQPGQAGGATHAAPSLAEVRAGHGVLQHGMKGSSVAEVQRLLHVTADGDFGPITERAVKGFQTQHHLHVDGIVGRLTLNALQHGTPGKTPQPQPGHTGTGGVAPGPTKTPQPGPTAGSESAVRAEVLSKAESHMGAPYYWGAQGPSMFDCSGFAWYVLHTDMHLVTAGRTNAEGLAGAPYTTHASSPEKGDLVFYGGTGNISHVTIATGSGSQTVGASGGGSQTHGDNPNAKVKFSDWTRDNRSKSFGSIKQLIEHKLGQGHNS